MKRSRATLIALLAGVLALTGCGAPRPGGLSATPTPSSSGASVQVARAAPEPRFALNVEKVGPLPAGVTLVADQKGRPNQALSFAGGKSKLELPWDINAKAVPLLTITAWARFTGDPSKLAQAQVLSQDNGGYDRSVGLDARGGSWGWSAFAGTGGVVGGAPVAPGQWVFLVVAYDQASKTTSFQVDDTVFPTKTGEIDEGHPFVWLGGNPSYDEPFVGDVAHVQLFDKALDSADLARLREE